MLHLQCAAVMSKNTLRGSAFLIAPSVALTARHCVEEHTIVDLRFMRQDEAGIWQERLVQAVHVADHDDCAVLGLKEIIDDVPGLELGVEVPCSEAAWHSYGWPASVGVGVQIGGVVRGLTTHTGMPNRLQVLCTEVGAGLTALGLSGSPLVIDGRVHGLMSNDLVKPGHHTSIGGTLYGLLPDDIERALNAAASTEQWPRTTITLNGDGGQVVLDPFGINVRSLANESVIQIPFAGLRKVWLSFIHNTNSAQLTIEATHDRHVEVWCSNYEEALQFLGALPDYVDRPWSGLTISHSHCREHPLDATPLRIAFQFSRGVIGHLYREPDIEDAFLVVVSASKSCVLPFEEAAVAESNRFSRYLWLAAVASVLGSIGMSIYMLTTGTTAITVVALFAALIPLLLRLCWRHWMRQRLRLATFHLFGSRINEIEAKDLKALHWVYFENRQPFYCNVRIRRRFELREILPRSRAEVIILAIIVGNIVNAIRAYLAATEAGIETGPAIGIAIFTFFKIMLYGALPAVAIAGLLAWASRRLLKRDAWKPLRVCIVFYLAVVTLVSGRAGAIQELVDEKLPSARACFEFEQEIKFSSEEEFVVQFSLWQREPVELRIEQMSGPDVIWNGPEGPGGMLRGDLIAAFPDRYMSGSARRICIAIDRRRGLKQADLDLEKMWLRKRDSSVIRDNLIPRIERVFLVPEVAGSIRLYNGIYHVRMSTYERRHSKDRFNF